MVAPSQRGDTLWARREAQDKERELERAKEFDAFRRAHIAKGLKAEQQRLEKQNVAADRWHLEQSQRHKAEKKERRQGVSARRRAFRDMADARYSLEDEQKLAKKQASGRAAWLCSNLLSAHEQPPVPGSSRDRLARLAKSLAEQAQKLEVENRLAVANAEADAEAKRAGQNVRAAARRADVVERRQQAIREQQSANHMIQHAMEREAAMRNEGHRTRVKTRRMRGELERDANIDYLNIDTRVAPWMPICWHDKDDERDWRWPFSLDWSWLVRGEHVLRVRNERFMGLTLPPGFVKPSDRIMAASERERERTTVHI